MRPHAGQGPPALELADGERQRATAGEREVLGRPDLEVCGNQDLKLISRVHSAHLQAHAARSIGYAVVNYLVNKL